MEQLDPDCRGQGLTRGSGSGNITELTIIALYHISRGHKVSTVAKHYGIHPDSLHRAVRDSIVRECQEMQAQSPGSVIKTVWDYNSDRAMAAAKKAGVYPDHVITIVDTE